MSVKCHPDFLLCLIHWGILVCEMMGSISALWRQLCQYPVSACDDVDYVPLKLHDRFHMPCVDKNDVVKTYGGLGGNVKFLKSDFQSQYFEAMKMHLFSTKVFSPLRDPATTFFF